MREPEDHPLDWEKCPAYTNPSHEVIGHATAEHHHDGGIEQFEL